MISSFDYYKQVISPDMYLCNPDQRELCALQAENRHLVLRFNDLSELTFTISKQEGLETHYDLIETKRLIKLDNIGWFQITNVVENIEGEHCSKSVTAESHQTEFKNRGFATEDRVYMFYNPNDPTDSKYDADDIAHIPSVVGQLYKQLGIKTLLNSTGDIDGTQKEWVITKIGESLKFKSKDDYDIYTPADGANNICRSFTSNSTLFGYDFMVNEASKAFDVVFIFDFLHHTIQIDLIDNVITPTDIYLSLDNLLNKISVTENAENITTVLNCNGTDVDIRTVNPMGTNYICNFGYYAKEQSDDGKIDYPWMSKELIEALASWKSEYYDCTVGFDFFAKTHKDGVLLLHRNTSNQEKVQTELTTAKLKLNDFQNAIDRHNNGADIKEETDEVENVKVTVPNGYDIAETVNIGKNSMDPLSKFSINSAAELYKVEYDVNEDGNTSGFNSIGGSWIDAYESETEEFLPLLDRPSFVTRIKSQDFSVIDDAEYRVTLSLNGNKQTFILTPPFSDTLTDENTQEKKYYYFGNLLSEENLMLMGGEDGNLCNVFIMIGATWQKDESGDIEQVTYDGITVVCMFLQGAGEIVLHSIEPSIIASNMFSNKTKLTCYKDAPKPIYCSDDKRFKFEFGESIEHKKDKYVDEMVSGLGIANFKNGEYQGVGNLADEPCLYFVDAEEGFANYSYCKLLPAISVGNLYNKDGNLIKTEIDTSITTLQPWFVKVRDMNFKINNNNVYKGEEDSSGAIVYNESSATTILNDRFTYENATYSINTPAGGIASVTCCYVKGFDRYIADIEVVGENGWLNLWQKKATNLEQTIKDLQVNIDEQKEFLKEISERCNIEKFIKRIDAERGSNLYGELRNYWIEGEYNNDNIKTVDGATIDETMNLAEQLKESGETELKKISQPTFTMTSQAVNFLRLIEFKRYIDQLKLGCTVTIEKARDVHYYPVLMSIEYDIDSSESFSISFSNAAKIDETAMTYADLIKEAASTSRTVSANWSNLIDYSKNKETYEKLINEPLNATLSAARINDANQEFVVDTTGILGRKFSDDSKTSFDNKQLRIRNNVLLFTDDSWKTAKLALGECYDGDGNSMGYGLIADTIVGNMIIGENMRIINKDNSISLDQNGITITKQDGTDVFKADNNGNLTVRGIVYATDGEFTGKIIANSGNVGGFAIVNNVLCTNGLNEFYTNPNLSDNAGFHLSTDGILFRGGEYDATIGETPTKVRGMFWIDAAGRMCVQQGSFSGNENAVFLSFDYDGLIVHNGYEMSDERFRSIKISPGLISTYMPTQLGEKLWGGLEKFIIGTGLVEDSSGLKKPNVYFYGDGKPGISATLYIDGNKYVFSKGLLVECTLKNQVSG